MVLCSALMVDAGRSETGGPLLGRNLDYPSLGYIHEYSLVTVYRPRGKHAFVSIGFPGLVGCLSGMNDAGLTVGVLEVFAAREGEGRFDPEGAALRPVLPHAPGGVLYHCRGEKEAGKSAAHHADQPCRRRPPQRRRFRDHAEVGRAAAIEGCLRLHQSLLH